MKRTEANKLIYNQAKNLLKTISSNQMVYIHWKNNTPLVLPVKEHGYDLINSVRLDSILKRQCWLIY